ncbi:MAG: hypothetical protein Q9M18_06600, partial [Mariprofundaceae bacterium]|nr:hypothetical protein [Mariprofundaceae bacterium]
ELLSDADSAEGDVANLTDDNETTVTIDDVSNELNLDDISLGDFDSGNSDLLSDSSDEASDLGASTHDDELNNLTEKMSALDDLDLNDVKSPDLDSFDDLNLDLDAVDHNADLEEFTSTIQATLKELGVDNNDLDESSEHSEDVDADDLDFGELNLDDFETEPSNTKDDLNANVELDKLLNELDNFSTK